MGLTVYVLFRSAAYYGEVTSHFDSRIATLALSSLTKRSRLVKECLVSLSMASNYFLIRLVSTLPS